MKKKVIVVGAGVGGLAAAIDLARRGVDVTVFEKNPEVGGKIRQARFGDIGIDVGPTVFTMRWIFEELFSDAGFRLDDYLTLKPADVLARHAWRDGATLDLFADREKSVEAISAFAGAKDAEGYRSFCEQSRQIYDVLRDPFMRGQRPSQLEVVQRVGLFNMPSFMQKIQPMTTLWAALGRHFSDPRLQQLFGRYATYVGSSPFATPSTIMLVAHVEQSGVWTAQGGMRAVAASMQAIAEKLGVTFHFNAPVDSLCIDQKRLTGVTLKTGDRIDVDAVVFNGDVSALGKGLLGHAARSGGSTTTVKNRSLSAVTAFGRAKTSGFPLEFHNVFFSDDYKKEFDEIFLQRSLPQVPTVYVCAQDRHGDVGPGEPERLFFLVNAPADGDEPSLSMTDYVKYKDRALKLMSDCGLEIEFEEGQSEVMTPIDFHSRFPATGGAIYGQSSHGMMSTLARAGAKTPIKNLYISGGSVHPGAGVPMATMSGRLAAEQFFADAGN